MRRPTRYAAEIERPEIARRSSTWEKGHKRNSRSRLLTPCSKTFAVCALMAMLLLSAAHYYGGSAMALSIGPLGITHHAVMQALETIPRLSVDGTIYEGALYQDSGVEFFGGIPYAMPPLGARRFAPPERWAAAQGAAFADASHFGKRCMQTPTPTRPVSDMSEDCLTINVFRPAARSDAPLPVMFWVYGGGFQSGTASIYNATAIVARSVALGKPLIVVSLNYRLGPWSQSLAADALNLGLRDIALGLRFTHSTLAAAAGGDPQRIVLAGQSAGAMSIWHLLADDSLRDMYDSVLLHSGGPDTLPLFRPAVRQPFFLAFAAAAECPPPSEVPSKRKLGLSRTMACLRTVDTARLLAAHRAVMDNPPVDLGAYSQFPWAPTIDGLTIRDDWARAITRGAAGKRVLVGANVDEGIQFVPQYVESDADALEMLARTFNSSARANRLWELYASHTDPRARAAATLGDVWFQAPVRRMARLTGAWYFLYALGRSEHKVTHGAEIPALFWPLETGMGFEMVDRWIRFVVGGTPDSDWAPYPSALELRGPAEGGPQPIDVWREEQIGAAELALEEMRAAWRA